MTPTRSKPSRPLGRRLPSGAWPLAASALLGLAAPVVAASPATTPDPNPPLMQGELLVQAHSGAACASPAALPLRLPLWAVWEDGQWWLWGDMAPMRLRPAAQAANTADLLGWADDTLQGQARWAEGQPLPRETAPGDQTVNRPNSPITARWQENETPRGCAFTAATLRLTPWATASDPTTPTTASTTGTEPTAASLIAHQRLLRDTLIAKAALQSAASAREAAEPLQRLLDLTRQASALPSARQDRNLALAWLQAGEHASALRQHPQALELMQAAWAVYEPLAPQSAAGLQDAALALSSLARAQLRARQPEPAQASLNRAIALLDRHQGTQTAAAASLHNQQGALWLRQQRARDALGSFARALAADEARQAPATERVATLMNSAVALEELGQTDAARAVYQRCQQLLASEPASARNDDQLEQLAQWVQSRLLALDGPGAGGVRTL